MFPMPNKQKSFETTDSSSSKSFAEPSIIKTEQELQQEIKAKTKELLSGFGGTEDGFSEKESAEQDKMVSDLFKTESVYSKTLAELKSQILSVISDKALENSYPNTRAAGYKLIPFAKKDNITLCELMREVTVFCDDATKDVGIWYKNPILQQMQGLLEQFNVKTFIKNWEEDIAKRELEFKTKQQEVEKQQGIVKNAILKASALVIKKETKKLNQTIQDLSMSINQSMDQSVRWENEQELTDPKTAKSMSKAMGSNLEIVQSETQKLKLLQGKCDKLAKDAFSERMQKFCSVRTSYAILKISEHQRILHQSIAPIMEVIKAMERLNKKTSKSAMFQPSDSSAPLTLEAQLLESYQQQIGLLNEIIFDLTSNTENDKTDEIIKKHYELVKQKFQGTATLVLLDDITKSKYKDEIPSKTNILMRAGFIANCYKIGAALLTNEMMSDRLTASIQGVTSGKTMTFKQG